MSETRLLSAEPNSGKNKGKECSLSQKKKLE